MHMPAHMPEVCRKRWPDGWGAVRHMQDGKKELGQKAKLSLCLVLTVAGIDTLEHERKSGRHTIWNVRSTVKYFSRIQTYEVDCTHRSRSHSKGKLPFLQLYFYITENACEDQLVSTSCHVPVKWTWHRSAQLILWQPSVKDFGSLWCPCSNLTVSGQGWPWPFALYCAVVSFWHKWVEVTEPGTQSDSVGSPSRSDH